MAPTYSFNLGAFVYILAQMFGLDIPYTSEQVELAVAIFGALGVQLFTMIRQLWTGRATILGGRGPRA